MNAIGVKKYRKCLAELQKIINFRKKSITHDNYSLSKRMSAGNPCTDFGRGYFDGYNAAMNDVLIMLSNSVYYAEEIWNKTKIRESECGKQ